MFTKFISEIPTFLLKNKEWLAIAIPVFALLVSISGYVVRFFVFIYKLIQKRVLTAYSTTEAYTKRMLKIVEKEPFFFDEPYEKKHYFYKGMVVNNQKKKKRKMGRLVKRSYLLIGEAGSGKSSFLKNDFLKARKKQLLRGRVYLWFLFSNELINYLDNKEEYIQFVHKIVNAKYKKIYLYIDGIDEIGENRMDKFFSFIKEVTCLKEIVLKITSRPEFSGKYIERSEISPFISEYIKIPVWNSKTLLKYGKRLLRRLILHKYDSQNDKINVYKSFTKKPTWKKFVNNPLLLKLYLYCELQGTDSISNYSDNRFVLYDHFVQSILKTTQRRLGEPNNNDKQNLEQDTFCKSIFEEFQKDSKIIRYSISNSFFRPLLKNPTGDTTFIHETFYEYFVARFYYNCTKLQFYNIDTIRVYCCNYSNDYADFITDALLKDNKKSRMETAQRFFILYYHTFNESTKKLYTEQFSLTTTPLSMRTISDNQFFSLKYELIFRLGRLQLEEPEIKQFLSFVYFNDFYTRQANDNDFFIAVLKRCCAISSSFIGGEEIEIDYVRHMLPYDKNNYKKEYDLANRTHTLLFYGDVRSRDLFSFRDEDPALPYNRALEKRIQRLSIKLPKDISGMSRKEKKKYYFRLFDLATVYTFLVHRNKPLSKKEYEIVSGCTTTFSGASLQRIELMNSIKNQILSFCNKF